MKIGPSVILAIAAVYVVAVNRVETARKLNAAEVQTTRWVTLESQTRWKTVASTTPSGSAVPTAPPD